MKKAILFTLMVIMVFGLTVHPKALDKVKAGFIYIGEIGDYGYTKSHDVARQTVDNKYSWLETFYAANVSPKEVGTTVDEFVNNRGADVIFTTSFGHMDPTIEAAKRYPNTLFFHCSGYKRRNNMGTYYAGLYQTYYLNGLMAGALTEANKLGFVGAFPVPEVKRQINAFAIGVKEVRPSATVHVSWLNAWVDPTSAKESTETLIEKGVDGFAFTEDTPTVLQTAQEYGLFGFGHYNPMYRFAEKAIVSGQIANWKTIYLDILNKVHSGEYTSDNLANVDYWWKMKQNAAILGAKRDMQVNPKYIEELKSVFIENTNFGRINVYNLIGKRVDQMKSEQFPSILLLDL